MALYIPHSIFHLERLLYVRPETFRPNYVRTVVSKRAKTVIVNKVNAVWIYFIYPNANIHYHPLFRGSKWVQINAFVLIHFAFRVSCRKYKKLHHNFEVPVATTDYSTV